MERPPIRVLIMDDSADNERIFLGMFNSDEALHKRYRLMTARNRRQAVICMDRRPDIALLDLRGASDIEGLETARELIQIDDQMKIIIMSSTDAGNIHVAAAALQEGFDFIEKNYVQTPQRMRLCLEVVRNQMRLAPPAMLLQAMASQLAARVAPAPKSDVADVEKFSLTPIERQIAWCYMANPTALTAEMADSIGVSTVAFDRAVTRLRSKVRRIHPDLPDGLEGREALVKFLREIGLPSPDPR